MLASRQGAIALLVWLTSESRNGSAAIAICRTLMGARRFAVRGSEAEEAERRRAFSAAALDDALAAVFDGAAVIAVMARLVVQIGRLRLPGPPRVADDLDGLTRHCRLRLPLRVLRGHQSPRLWAAFAPQGGNRVSRWFRRNLHDEIF